MLWQPPAHVPPVPAASGPQALRDTEDDQEPARWAALTDFWCQGGAAVGPALAVEDVADRMSDDDVGQD